MFDSIKLLGLKAELHMNIIHEKRNDVKISVQVQFFVWDVIFVLNFA